MNPICFWLNLSNLEVRFTRSMHALRNRITGCGHESRKWRQRERKKKTRVTVNDDGADYLVLIDANKSKAVVLTKQIRSKHDPCRQGWTHTLEIYFRCCTMRLHFWLNSSRRSKTRYGSEREASSENRFLLSLWPTLVNEFESFQPAPIRTTVSYELSFRCSSAISTIIRD